MKRTDTSWQKVGSWYHGLVDKKGHYYHQHIIMPGALRLLELEKGSSLLDLACGQGILGRSIPIGLDYVGIDNASSLIAEAGKFDRQANHRYITGDVTLPLPIHRTFTHAAIILALQNIADPGFTVKNAAEHLETGGILVIVLNHPCFRIPRQSSWEIDPGNKIEYRRINRYLSPLRIPITAHPGEKNSALTWSFHQPVSFYSKLLHDAGFSIDLMEEWTSDKESEGTAARMENRARSEFPLFLAIKAKRG
jgi:SAM-dependent methyltransferase